MSVDLGALSVAAITIGFFHTLCGPDHYLPFLAMARSGRWTLRKTVLVTLLCGIGHVGSSVVLGCVGIAFGVVVLQLETIEHLRGDVAGWLLLAFGLVYFLWGTVRAIRNRPHTHLHPHADGMVHLHEHIHQREHSHPHAATASEDRLPHDAAQTSGSANLTPWVLFVIFLFGPCEPLIPLLMYPAAKADAWGVVCIATLFALATLVTMTSLVAVMYVGVAAIRFRRIARYSHALAGFVVLCCGLAIKFGL